MNFLLGTPRAMFYQLIVRAQERAGVFLRESTEAYLVLTLENSVREYSLDRAYLFRLLEAQGSEKQNQKLVLVARQALVMAGFFPKRLIRFGLSTQHFRCVSEAAFYQLHLNYQAQVKPVIAEEYRQLSDDVPEMVEVLQVAREGNEG